MDIRLSSAPNQGNLPVGAQLSLTLDTPLPSVTGHQPGQPLTVAVVGTQGAGTVLQLPDGQTVTARLTPSLPVGSQLQLTMPAATPTGTPVPSSPLHLPVKLVSLPTATPASTPSAPAPTSGGAAHPPTLTLVQPTVTGTTTPLSPNTLAAGPVLMQLAKGQSLPPAAANTVLNATITGAADAQGYQTATAPLAPGAPLIRLSLNTGTPLPPGTTVRVQPVLTAAAPATPQPAMLMSPAPLAAAPTPALPAPEAHTLRLAAPATPETLPEGVFPARVLGTPTPAPGGLMVQQPVILPNGQHLLLESPHGVEGGSLLMVQLTPANLSILHLQAPSGRQMGDSVPLPSPPDPTLPATNSFPPRGTILQGTVSGQLTPDNSHPTGQLMLRITTAGPWQNLEVPITAAGNLPVGSRLTLQLTGNGQATVLNTVLPAPITQAQALTTVGESWHALTQLVRTLPGMLPSLAQSLGARLPQLANFTPTFLPYADAIAQNNPDRTFGPDVAAFARALGLDLRNDIQQLNQLQQPQQAQPGQPEPWRGILFPYQEKSGEDPRQGKFFWRRQQSEDESAPPAGASSSTRFVVELSLTRFGPLQLDGLMNYPNLWMKLRLTKTPLDAGLVGNLQQLVTATLEKVGLNGGIAVEQTTSFPVDPAADVLAAAQRSHSTVV